jgi:peptide deformylase
MAILKIFQFPDKVLLEKAKPIGRVEKTYHRLADDMFETMYSAPGIGLAANQVGVLERIVVIDVDYENKETGIENRKPIILINPKIVYREGSIELCEGCLSVPEYQAEVKRAEKIKVEYQDVDGAQKTLSAEGLLAVCVQHELDHLDGKLFIDRLSTAKKSVAKKTVLKTRKDRGEI